MGCTGNSLATGIDAPPEPKVSPIPDLVPVVGGGIGDSQNRPYMSVELCNLAGKRGWVKRFIWKSCQGEAILNSSLGCLAHHSIGQNVSAKVGILSPLTEAPNMSENSSGQNEKPSTTLPGTVERIIESPHPGMPEKAQIGVEGAEDLYREIRIENVLTDEDGQEVALKKGAPVEVTIEADPEHTTKKSD
jgi:hypothetical protein